MEEIKSKDALKSGTAFVKEDANIYSQGSHVVRTQVPYDLIGDVVKETGLTRKAVVNILTGIREDSFEQFKDNPAKFIILS